MRITENGVLYEADPRHAEMLIKAFHLEDAKSVVTPGVKVQDDDVDPDKVDADAAEEIHRIISELKARPRTSAKVRFSEAVETHDISPYSQVYGQHPRTFNFDKRGRLVIIEPNDVTISADVEDVNELRPNARRQILEKVLRDGAAWETPTVELLVADAAYTLQKGRSFFGGVTLRGESP